MEHKYATLVFSTISSFIGYLLGDIDGLLAALFTIIAIEYVSSRLNEIINKTISLSAYLIGLLRYLYIFTMVGLSNFFDKSFLQGNDSLRYLVILFYILSESLTLINNAEKLGLPIPNKLKDALELINRDNHQRIDGNDDTTKKGDEKI